MIRPTLFISAAALSTVLFAARAAAQERPANTYSPVHALELSAAFGATEGFGNAGHKSVVRVQDLATGGLELTLGIGFRASPYASFDLNASYQWYVPGDSVDNGAGAQGVSGDLGPTLHVAPFSGLDPWLRLGVGYRAMYEVGGPGRGDPLMHGPKLLKAAVGLDLRPWTRLSLAPYAGADIDAFVYDREMRTTTKGPIALNVFVGGGVLARFDLSGRIARERYVLVGRR